MAEYKTRNKKPRKNYLTISDIPTLPAPLPRVHTPPRTPEYPNTCLVDMENARSSPTSHHILNTSQGRLTEPNSPDTLVEQPSSSLLSFDSSSLFLLSKEHTANLSNLSPHFATLLPSPMPRLPLASIDNTLSYPIPKTKKRKRSPHEKLLDDLQKISEHLERICQDFDTLGEFLRLLFWHKGRKRDTDLRQPYHKEVVCRFLQGRSKVKVVHIIRKIYQHPHSQPSWQCNDVKEQRAKAFSLEGDPVDIRYARPAIASYVAQLYAARAHRDLTILTKNDPDHPEDVPARVSLDHLTWDDIHSFSPDRAIATFQCRTPYLYTLFEYLAAPRKKGVSVERKYRPVDIHVVVSINALVVGHNRYVNGYLPIHLGVQLFSCQVHVNIKRWLCRMGLVTSDKTVRRAIANMTEKKMQESTINEAARNEVTKCYVLDNCQRNSAVHEGGGLLLKTIMKVGTAATEIGLQDCPQGAWDLKSHLSLVSKNCRSSMTVDTLWESINWSNQFDSQALYIVKTLVDAIPFLHSYSKVISDRFRTAPIAIHRIPEDRQTKIQPLGTNSEREVEIHGLKHCIEDFDEQIGFTAGGADETTLEWISGDGATFQTFLNLQKYLAPTALGNRETLRNKIATPET
ncbi:hypothetical protein K435DRAFT_806819 [Dendrothele bispora CBS 962.96]|uniref:DUF6589 domain-containing protein n=1 Tax=Dendrothele bispora (strain CBS 962.96) TaxID=1314807 RepID=A0A4V4HCQ5_DENBC|nr:hypothetical protein K435DRAFT_806819 [Dendrothele bispora CBS 962.96]